MTSVRGRTGCAMGGSRGWEGVLVGGAGGGAGPHRAALGVAQVRVHDLDEVEGVLVVVADRLDVERDDRPHLIERAHLADDPDDGSLPARGGRGRQRMRCVQREADRVGRVCARLANRPPLCALLGGRLVLRSIDPHLDVDRAGAIVNRVLQVGVLLVSIGDQTDNRDLMQVLAVHREAVVAPRRRGVLQLLDGRRQERLLVELLPL